MKSLVVYDSNYGNTKLVAEAICQALGKTSRMVAAGECQESDLEGLELLVAGSPINGWRPTEKMIMWLNSLKEGQLTGVQTAAFDTRVELFFHGDAAKKIAHKLEEMGGQNVGEPMGFIVKGSNGPLAEGELKRAEDWIAGIKRRI